MTKICLECSKAFMAQRLSARKKFCSVPCRLKNLHRTNAKPRATLICAYCREKFTVERGPHIEKVQRHCSRKCGNVSAGKQRNSILNGHWKGGVSKSTQGYLIVTHGNNANRLVHRVVMEQKLGRKLRSSEIVHHINHDKTDNRTKNLAITNRSEHATHHLRDAWRRIKS